MNNEKNYNTLYEKRSTEKVVTYKKTSSLWSNHWRSTRLKSKATQNHIDKIKLSSRFETKGADAKNTKKPVNRSIEIPSRTVKNKKKTSNLICNILSSKLSESEILPLNKGLHFSFSSTRTKSTFKFTKTHIKCQKWSHWIT